MYGAQTRSQSNFHQLVFENDVEMYGAQTIDYVSGVITQFENDVEMYGAQTCLLLLVSRFCLRMM